MRKIRIILAAVFCVGVLLAGVGTGICFLEFSSFTYAGEKEIGVADIKTVTLEYELEEETSDEEPLNIGRRDMFITSEKDITEDETVPVNTVRFEVTYNAEEVEPFLNYTDTDNYLFLDYFYQGDDFKDFMMSKDILLEEIKNREISTYKNTRFVNVKVMVNPESRERVQVN